tara:strand:- start:1065 stop:1679 length:615 start_codon:yes stop_codon:yes gene_type:complete
LIGDNMNQKVIFSIAVVVLLSGCIEPNAVEFVEEAESKIPKHISFNENTLGRDIDGGDSINLKSQYQKGPVLLMWVSTQCTGCHEWTDLIRNSTENGDLELGDVQMISVLRYVEYETETEAWEVFGDLDNGSYPSPWPVVIPTVDSKAIDLDDARNTNTDLFEAFGMPSTPTLQLLSTSGEIVWESGKYRANLTTLENGLSTLD